MVNLTSLELNIVHDVNHYRSSHSKSALENSDTLAAIARSHSQALANKRNADLLSNRALNKNRLVINHDGFDRRFQLIKSNFPRISSAAENVAVNLNSRSPVRTAVEGWIQSAGHEKNMVGNYNKTGVGIARSSDGAYFFTQLFAK